MPVTANNALQELAASLTQWMHDCAWPLWWRAGRRANGTFVEGLDFQGRPVDDNTSRVRVQARQVFSFALAANQGWKDAQFSHEALAESVQTFVTSCLRPDGLGGRRIDVGQPALIDATADLYDTAFCLLALAESTACLGETATMSAIGQLLTGLDQQLAYPDAQGYREALPADRVRLQNPHMHLFEALLRLYEVTGSAQVRERIDALFAFASETFFDRDADWVSERVGPEGKSADFEPGHSMEWVWLLGYYARLTGLPVDPFADQLYRQATRHGIAEGRIPLQLAADGRMLDASRRLWSQTESLKAHLHQLETSDSSSRDDYLKAAVECAQSLHDDWLGSPQCAGGWRDHFDADGELLSAFMPASSGYHVYLALAELSRVAASLTVD